MKLFKLISLLLVAVFMGSNTFAQANGYINIQTQNSGVVNIGGAVFIEVTVGNAGPVDDIPSGKLRAQISVPGAIVSIPTSGHVLPSGWTILSNSGMSIQICNSGDIIPLFEERIILINLNGVVVGGPSTLIGQLDFRNNCTNPGSLNGDDPSDNSSTTTIQVVPSCPLVVTASAGTIACNGGTTTLTASVTGNTGAIEYKLNSGAYQPSNTFAVNAAGSPYIVTAREVSNPTCTATTSVTITEPSALTASASSTPVSVIGGTDGTATVTGAGGIAPYTYLWTPGGQTTATATGLSAGSYSVLVTDANGCTATATTTVGSPACNVVLSFTQVNVLCFGASTGSATVTAANTTGTVTYLWSNGQTGATATGLAAGTYSVTVTDGAGCTASGSVTITQPASAIVAAESHTAILCFGGTSNVTISATGGTAPYTGTGTFTQVAGTQSYTVTDANGCTSTVIVTVAQPAQLVAAESHTAILCFGGTSTVTISATGGTAPYTGTGTFTQVAGTQSYIVTDANGCTSTVSVTVAAAPSQLVAAESHTAILCFGGTSNVTISATGGTAPYSGTGTFTQVAGTQSYTVTDANGCTSTESVTVAAAPSQLVAAESHTAILCFGGTSNVTISETGGTAPYTGTGTFTQVAGTQSYTVADANGCISTVSVIVTQPSEITVSVTTTPVTIIGGTDGTATVIAAGGTVPYTYLWTPGGQTTATATGLTTGNYSVTVSDANGCTISAITTVGSPACNLFASASAGTIACNGGTTTLTVTATGGTGSLQYSLNGGTFQSGNTFTVGAGSYIVTIQDANLCTATATVSVIQPATITASASAGTIACNGGTTTLTVTTTGGTGSLQYSLNGGTFQSGNTFTVGAGSYTVTIQDANLCTATATVSVIQPATITASASAGTIACNGGTTTLTVTATGGTGSLQYSLNGGTFQSGNTFTVGAGSYTVTIQDANLCTATATVSVIQPSAITASASAGTIACNGGTTTLTVTATGGTGSLQYSLNGGTFQSGNTFTVGAGSYTVTIQDANLCTATATVSVIQPATITASASASTFACNSATTTLTVTATGGTGSLQYSLNGGTFQSGNTFTVGAGSYIVTIQDANLCTATATVSVIQPATITASASAGTIACNGGTTTLTVTATGGTGSLQYSLNGGTFQSGNTFTIGAGSYTVTIQDANLCTATATVSVIQPATITASASASTFACNSATTTLTVTATGGTGSLQYSLNGGTFQSGNTFTVGAGSYIVTIQDANLCTATATVSVIQPATITASASAGTIACNGGTTTLTVTATGGTGSLQYSLNGGTFQSGNTFTIGAGSYTVTIQDANLCTATATVSVIQPSAITASASAGTIACNGGTTTLTVTATGGTGSLQYSLNGGTFQSGNTFTVGAGSYTVTIQDANLCTATATVSVIQPSAITASASAGTIACNGGTTTLTVTATGGTGSLQYSLNGGTFQSGNTFTVGAGSYTVTIQDANLCTATATVSVIQPAIITASASAQRITSCGGTTKVTVLAFGGRAPYTGIGTFYRGPGTWTFLITDVSGCTATTEITIEAPGCMNLRVYPNPVTNSIYVNHSKADLGSIMKVYSLNGALVITKSIPQNSFLTTINVERLAAGSYILVFFNGNEKKEILFNKISSN